MVKWEIAHNGNSARVLRGLFWTLSQETDPEGNLTNDVVIGDYTRPWNAHPNARGLRRDIPKASYWAYDPNGINQVGCVYTAQGFEFDYVGVIFGLDLTYNFDENQWEAHPDQSEDRAVRRSKDYFELVKNTYRILMTRGHKGCYVHFMDKDTEKYFKGRIIS